jgi:hypothetical protein
MPTITLSEEALAVFRFRARQYRVTVNDRTLVSLARKPALNS